MAAKSSKVPRSAGASPVQQSSLQALMPPPPAPAPAPVPTFTVKDLQDVLQEALKKQSQQLAELMEEKLTEMRADILLAFQGMAVCIERLDERVEDLSQNNIRLDAKMTETENVVDKIDDDLTLVQYREMEFAVRIRGLKEDSKENLKKIVSEALEGVLERPAEEIMEDIDKIFRVNSWIARQRKLPRDVVVYFTKRAIRNEVIQAFYNNKFAIAEQEVLVLKEIPPRILRRRKEFAFLAQELRRRDIQFRWDIPVGMVVMYAGMRHRLLTVLQARDFYTNVLKAVPIPLLESKKKNGEGESQPQSENVQGAEGVTQVKDGEFQKATGVDQISVSSEEVRDQRVTRAAARRMRREQEQEQQRVMMAPPKLTYSEAVGGARPKRVQVILEEALQKLQVAKDGDKVSNLEC